jgi:hypothetical protein
VKQKLILPMAVFRTTTMTSIVKPDARYVTLMKTDIVVITVMTMQAEMTEEFANA